MIHPRIIDKPLGVLVARLPRGLYTFMSLISIIASPLVLAGVLVFIVISSAWSDNDQLLWAALIALMLTPLAEFSKLITRRRRPETLYAQNMRLQTYSFPSGHAYVSALVFGFLAIAVVGWMSYNVLFSTIFISLAFLVGVSRVYLGAHFPSDVLAGWFMGAAAQYLVWIKTGL